MIDLSNIKTILQFAGISSLLIKFDNEKQIINIWYVFKSVPGKKQISFQEVTKLLSIGQPGPSESKAAVPAGNLMELPGET